MKALIYFTACLFLLFSNNSFSQNQKKEDCVCKNLSISEGFMPFRQRISKYLKKPNLSKFVKDVTPLNKEQFEDLRIIDANIEYYNGERLLQGKIITKNYLDFKLDKIGGLTLRLNPCLQKGKHVIHIAEILLEKEAFNINFKDQYLSFLFSKELFTPINSKKKQSELIFKASKFKYQSKEGLWFFLPKEVQFTESKIGKTKLSIDFKHFIVQDLHERNYKLDKGGLVVNHIKSKVKHWFKTYEIPLKRNLIGSDYFYGELYSSKSKYKKGIIRKLKKRMTYVYETENELKFYYTTKPNPTSEIPEDIKRLFNDNDNRKSRRNKIKNPPKPNVTLSNHFDADNDFIDEDEEIEIIEDSGFNEADEVFSIFVCDEKPIFPGCESVSKTERAICFQQKLMKYIGQNIILPKVDAPQRSKVYVSFTISKTGIVEDVKLVRKSTIEAYNNEALKVIKKLPNMVPAKLKGKSVATTYTIPITFNP